MASWRMGLLFVASNLDWNDMMTDMTRMALLFADVQNSLLFNTRCFSFYMLKMIIFS